MIRFGKRMCLVGSIIFLLCMVSGCAKGEITEMSDDSETGVTVASGVKEISVTPLNLTQYSLGYQEGTDDVQFCSYQRVAGYTENGLYFWANDQGMLLYFDYELGEYYPVCSKPDCAHVDDNCSAFFNSDRCDGVRYSRNYLQYYEGMLYIHGYDEDGVVSLYSITPDGSIFRKEMELYRVDISLDENGGFEYKNPEILIHRGYVYYINHMDEKECIRRAKLGASESEVVFYNSGQRANTYRMKGIGDYLFFQSGCFVDDEYVNINSGIWAYNIHTGEVQYVVDNAYAFYYIAGNELYYLQEQKLYCVDLLMQQTDVIIDQLPSGPLPFYIENDYIYVDCITEANVLFRYKREDLSLDTCSGTAIGSLSYLHDNLILGPSATNSMKQYERINEIMRLDELEWK